MKIKKIFTGLSACSLAIIFASCGGGGTKAKVARKPYVVQTTEVNIPAKDSLTPGYTILEKTQIDLESLPKDKDGYYTLFDGESFYGWRGYNKDAIPGKWKIEDKAIKFSGTGAGEAQDSDGGDIVFARKFKNFELSIDWKVAKGANSGIFYLAQEIKDQPIYVSAPESQVLDNENHPDAKLGENGNRQSSSLYDMIPADPQNSKPFGQWNNTSIMVYKGTVVHRQNGKNVLEYHLWTPQWTEMLQNCKFSQKKWPVAFALLNNCGGDKHEGYIGLQDHGDDVWFKNIKVKILD
jgi:hypothetical protein